MQLIVCILLFFIFIAFAYFVLDIAIKNENEGMKVFGAILFTFLVVISLALLFGGVYLTITGVTIL